MAGQFDTVARARAFVLAAETVVDQLDVPARHLADQVAADANPASVVTHADELGEGAVEAASAGIATDQRVLSVDRAGTGEQAPPPPPTLRVRTSVFDRMFEP